MNNKAFTLVELLAVIGILAIILIIATTVVSSSIENAKKHAFISSSQALAKSANDYLVDNWETITKPAVGIGLPISITTLKNEGYLDNTSNIPQSVIVIFNNANDLEIYVYASNGKYIIDGYQSDNIKDNVEDGNINYIDEINFSTTYLITGNQLIANID